MKKMQLNFHKINGRNIDQLTIGQVKKEVVDMLQEEGNIPKGIDSKDLSIYQKHIMFFTDSYPPVSLNEVLDSNTTQVSAFESRRTSITFGAGFDISEVQKALQTAARTKTA